MRWLLALLLLAAAPVDYAPVRPGVPIVFPRDHGAHPAFRTEWWYATGWLKLPDGTQRGFQVTFFRTRPPVDMANPSAFAPRQVLFAHAALSDPQRGHLRHDQRIARAGFGLAEAATADTDVHIDDWAMRRGADGVFRTRVQGDGYALDLALAPTQPPLLQGDRGFSRKGPAPGDASHYYSLPHLKVTGTVVENGRKVTVTGSAWLDREWSSNYLNPQAVGWDWLGLNMDDGGALTLFRIRDRTGTALWAGGSYRGADGRLTALAPGDVRFATLRRWRSPRTGASYPVAQAVTVMLRGKPLIVKVTPLFDDQELDSRRGGGPVYWEGAVTVPGGRGYLEMTGYQAALKL